MNSGPEFKTCKGPLHREGIVLPRSKFHVHANGSLFSQCVECRNYYLGRPIESGLVKWQNVEPLFQRLFDILGGKTHAAEALGLPKNSFSRKHEHIRRQTFYKVIELLNELDTESKRGSAKGEPEVVFAEPLGSILREWEAKWVAERPRNNRDFTFVGPINYLAEQTGINVDRVSQILNSKHPRVPLSQADALITAIGRTLNMHPEIKVVANPNWSAEGWFKYMEERGCI